MRADTIMVAPTAPMGKKEMTLLGNNPAVKILVRCLIRGTVYFAVGCPWMLWILYNLPSRPQPRIFTSTESNLIALGIFAIALAYIDMGISFVRAHRANKVYKAGKNLMPGSNPGAINPGPYKG